jgi:hypothetical protein
LSRRGSSRRFRTPRRDKKELVLETVELGNVAGAGDHSRDMPPPGVGNAGLADVQVAVAVQGAGLEEGRIDPVRAFVADAGEIVLHLVDAEIGQRPAMGGIDVGHGALIDDRRARRRLQ